jgi:hypothetical protein
VRLIICDKGGGIREDADGLFMVVPNTMFLERLMEIITNV